MRFNFITPSPTYINLSYYLQKRKWKSTSHKWLSHFNENNFDFDLNAAQVLEYKHELMRLVNRFCPQVMPITYEINEKNWIEILNLIAEKYYRINDQLIEKRASLAWILKPSLLNNGQHIKIFTQLSQLEQHYLSSKRLGGPHVLQHYIMHPHLLKGPKQGHKYSIRLFVVLTNYAGTYLYPKGYFNIGLHPYSSQFNDLRPHLTNEHLNEQELNVVQIPSFRYELFDLLYPKTKAIILDVLQGLEQLHPQAFRCQDKRKLALFGFDFLVDRDLQVYLLEANHAPCFPLGDEHPLQNSLYADFWEALISSFVVPIAQKQKIAEIEYQLFEQITGGSS